MTETTPATHTPPTHPLQHETRAIIVGASSGIGAALARALAADGYDLALVARRQAELDALANDINESGAGRAQAYVHDVLETTAVPALFQQITTDLGGLDLVVYVAGIMPLVGPDEYDTAKDAAMIDVNVKGAMAWLNEAAVRFGQTGGGHIVGISSIAGDRGRVGFPGYSSSKAALSTYLEALRNRLSRRGVTVTTVKPGMVETAMLADVDRKVWPVTPEAAAADIRQAIRRRRQTVYVPARWRLVALVIQHIPSVIFRRLSF